MTTPERDPLGDMFDQYAAATAAETTRSTTGQLRRRMHRHRTGRFAAAGVAAAVLAVPGVWALQNAGAADEPVGAADQGSIEHLEPCPMVELTMTAIVVAEGTTLEEFSSSETARAMILELPEGTTFVDYWNDPDIKVAVIPGGEGLEHYLDPEDYGVALAMGGDVPTELDGFDQRAEDVAEADLCAGQPTEEPSEESGTPGDEPTGAESEAGEEPTGPGGEPTDAGEEPTEAGDEEPTGESTPGGDEEPTPGDDEEPTASEQSTP